MIIFRNTIQFTPANLAAFKSELRKRFPEIKSGHADEAIANCIGFRTYASMLSTLKTVGPSARLIVQADQCLLSTSLERLGYSRSSPLTLFILIRETKYPDNWRDDQIETDFQQRFAPIAANSV